MLQCWVCLSLICSPIFDDSYWWTPIIQQSAISNRKFQGRFSNFQFSRLLTNFELQLYHEGFPWKWTLCEWGSVEFISSFILIEVIPCWVLGVLNTQSAWFMKICNYTFCLNLQCNLLGYGTKNWKLYKQTNLSFRSNIIWSLETFMCDTPCQTKN